VAVPVAPAPGSLRGLDGDDDDAQAESLLTSVAAIQCQTILFSWRKCPGPNQSESREGAAAQPARGPAAAPPPAGGSTHDGWSARSSAALRNAALRSSSEPPGARSRAVTPARASAGAPGRRRGAHPHGARPAAAAQEGDVVAPDDAACCGTRP
jgi:hypothetical protein